MNHQIKNEDLDILISRYPSLICVKDKIENAYNILATSFENNGKLLVAGNGGSCADAEHISGELLKSFKIKRKISEAMASKLKAIDPGKGNFLSTILEESLPTIPIVSFNSFLTAYSNDTNGSRGEFAQLVYSLGNANDTFLAISTSGNSENIVYAAIVAKAKNMKIISMTGGTGGKLALFSDVVINVPEKETYRIQELHLPIYHTLCIMLEKHFFGDNA